MSWRVSWEWGKGGAPESGEHGTVCPGQWAHPCAAGDQGVLGQRCQKEVMKSGWCCVVPGVGLSGPCRLLPT